ncbi:MAG TPA: hypothetical protein VN737_06785 [Bryobacteraceae bacterium]|nr:hypothetical protein [Bryobacteraceae bacterium]
MCLFFTLFVVLVGPLHTHHSSSNSDTACLLCHAADRAIVVPVTAETGKPLNNPPVIFLAPRQHAVAMAGNVIRKTPRAPPAFA